MLLIFQGALVGQQKHSSELDRYIQNIRNDRMTEDAKLTMETISSIRTGHTTLTFVKDSTSGTYGTSYGSTFCPRPGTDSSENLKISKQIDADVNADIKKIRPLADFDNSGFITTDEANRFRRVIEFGLLANFVAKKGEPESIVVRSFGIPKDRLRKMIEDYKNMVRNARNLGVIDIPAWPFPD